MKTIRQALADGRQLLSARADIDPHLEAEILLAHLLQKDRSWLYAWSETELPDARYAEFQQLLQRRIAGTPVAYLTGRREFWSLPLQVSSDTLIPRPETELLVSTALELLPDQTHCEVLELGTGTGAIALAIASERPRWRITATDISAAALNIARENLQQHHIDNVTLIRGEWFKPVANDRPFKLIISNPPYIARQDPHLDQGDVRFEPVSALSAGADGLADLREIIAQAPLYLESKGYLLVEHGQEQGVAVRKLFVAANFRQVTTLKDMAGLERTTFGRNP